jgi:hypothetical protein
MTFGDQIYRQTKTIRKRHECTTYFEENHHECHPKYAR